MYIPEKRKNRQITLFDFNQSCGMEFDPNNEWIRLAHAIPWSRMELVSSDIRKSWLDSCSGSEHIQQRPRPYSCKE